VIDTAFTSVVQKGADALLVGPYVFFYDSDLVVMPSGGRIFAFFALRATTSLKIQGAFIPRRVFTQAGP
jgi:hypothetical protein